MKEILPFISILPLILIPLTLVVHILLCMAVSAEAKKLRAASVRLYGLDSHGWTFVVLITGVFGFGLFWLIHNSALRNHGLFKQ